MNNATDYRPNTRQTERLEPTQQPKSEAEIQAICKREFEKMDDLLARAKELLDNWYN